MSYGPVTGMQVAKSLSVNASLTTSPPWFTGDFVRVTISASTQSNTGVLVQSSNADGFVTAIPENSWHTALTITGLVSTTSIFNIPVIGRWSRTSSQANSNATLIFAGRT